MVPSPTPPTRPSPGRSPRNDQDEREERILIQNDALYMAGPPASANANGVVPTPSTTPAGKPKLLPQFKFVWSMIGVNTLIFIIEIAENGWTVESLKVNPLIGPSAQVLLSMGAQRTDLIKDGAWWRLFTAMFLHAGVVHLLFNMAALYQLGMELESTFDRRRIATIYFATGIIGAIVSGFFVPDVVGVGASGAIFGLFGATFAEFMLNWKLYTNRVCHMTNLVVVALVNLGIGLLPFVNNFAHLSGFISGLSLGFGMLSLPLSRQDRIMGTRTKKQRLLGYGGLLFTAFFAILFLALFASNTNAMTACPWCKYLDCIPAPWWSCDATTSGECLGEKFNNGTLRVTCPSGRNVTAPTKSEFTAALCTSLCS
ncbi:hypothetical protein SPRG_09573 [Saprolegnia parasitica CBS 223.65]|uniref:rhomboid protease n=1 Tax=Saprolegnia parasitica (strain CBS 223.65) TaxID=695850 RepID=A0A067C2B3_SAPPC|nr:hypothetical protein SPRG_09573 [Saprolegnia parasitica CBS 223.65]KDO24929.1 hypothetical protein SPRG_09573 [Saprolegnia parasitica CBS 223.65]|eukprot:XP_012204389.1 hypothetical protein SPRG_09573 [Saprolegnia parasitica CBS 223.65]